MVTTIIFWMALVLMPGQMGPDIGAWNSEKECQADLATARALGALLYSDCIPIQFQVKLGRENL